MTDKLYTLSDLEALRERCAKVLDKNSCRGPCCKGRRDLADRIRTVPLTTHTEEGTR